MDEQTQLRTVLVTGAHGFIGRNLIAHLRAQPHVRILTFDVSNTNELWDAVHQCDFVFHLAGVNRPMHEHEFVTGNSELTDSLVQTLKATGRKIPLLISSSTQAILDNPYGRSKKIAEEHVFGYGRTHDVPVFVYRLPGVFGKWCRPNYNSVVATFCYNINHNLPIQINNPDTVITLAYIDDVVRDFISALTGEVQPHIDGYFNVSRIFQISLQSLADLLTSFHVARKTGMLPNMDDLLTKFLYTTYLSYLETDNFAYSPDFKIDQRGWLFELIKSTPMGQIFISQTKPGITRGMHYHHTKVEKFVVLQGEALIRFRHIGDAQAQVIQYPVSGQAIQIVDIPPGYTHDITNIGTSDLITLFWACEIFDPQQPDTYMEKL